MERLQGETDAKIKVLQEQRARAKAHAKAKHDKRIAELRVDYDRRVDKLIQASEMLVGLTARLGMRLMGVKYAVILGLFTAVTQFIPQVGGAIGMIASVALTSLQRPMLALGVFVLYMVLYQISGTSWVLW